MRIATLAVMSDDGHQVWSGSALEFIRANEMSRDDVTEMVAVLRGVPGMPPEPYIMGGGAAATSYVMLVANIDIEPATEYCWNCDAPNGSGYFTCIACNAKWDQHKQDLHMAMKWAAQQDDAQRACA